MVRDGLVFAMSSLDTGQLVTLACVLEASAPKPGNVHPAANFRDATYSDFVASAVAIGPVFRQAHAQSVGKTVLDAICSMQSVVRTNTSLGTILLLAPLAAVPPEVSCREGVEGVLARLNATDCRDVYLAIRKSQPGGLGKIETADVHDEPPDDLREAMTLAADRDLVARQYANGFADVLEFVLPTLVEFTRQTRTLNEAIVLTHLATMARYPDSLIARKCGAEIAAESARRAQQVLTFHKDSDGDHIQEELAKFDTWLRDGEHRRNPGTTADLLAASLFVKLRDELWP